ncbi:DUF4179 domain-containing protein [Brevibacillus agri]|uniref:DUF4179 domain-containing protein n=2 Tax=Brevibacillus agri TaxID=51101 RepID=UPI003D25C70D
MNLDMEKTEGQTGTQVPPQIEHYIRSGIAQAKSLRHRQRRSRLVQLSSWVAAGCLLLAFVFSVRLSPAVAAYVSHIPGMEKLVELIREDKGLQRAAEHEMVQDVSTSGSLEGITFKIDQVLTDQKRMLLFYTLKHERTGHKVGLRKLELFDASGKEYGASWSSMDVEASAEEKNRIDIFRPESSEVPDTLTAKVTLDLDGAELNPPLAITFSIDHSKYTTFEKKVVPVGKKVTVDGQTFTIEQMTVFPTQTEVSIRFDPGNSKHIFGFDDLRLVDENGQTYAFWGNGVPTRDNGENGKVYNLESIYFLEPQKLFLKANGIRALDRDKLQVVIDAKTQKLVKAPDARLKLTALRQVDDVVGMDWELEVEEADAHRFIHLGSDITDNQANKYDYVQGSSSSRDPEERFQTYSLLYKRLTKNGAPDSYTFTLTDYPVRLQGAFTVQVK